MNKNITFFSLLSLAAIASSIIAMEKPSKAEYHNGALYYTTELTQHTLSFSPDEYLLINGHRIHDNANNKFIDGFPAKEVDLKSIGSNFVEVAYKNAETNEKQNLLINAISIYQIPTINLSTEKEPERRFHPDEAIATTSIAMHNIEMIMSKNKTAYYIGELTQHTISFSSEGYLLINKHPVLDVVTLQRLTSFPAKKIALSSNQTEKIKKVTLKSLSSSLVEVTYDDAETNEKQKFAMNTEYLARDGWGSCTLLKVDPEKEITIYHEETE